MHPYDYKTARAMFPHRPDLWDSLNYLYVPLPPPEDHPELGLFPDDLVTTEDATAPPALFADPIPARMLNEFVYCPRLFYYEFVDGVFVENADTERGAAIHKKVDKGRGDLPPAPLPTKEREVDSDAPSDEATETTSVAISTEIETIHSRSATLGSDRLGVIAKMDLVEVELVSAPPSPISDLPSPTPSGVHPSPDPKPGRKSAHPQLDLFAPAQQASPITERFVQRVTPVDYKVGSPRLHEDGVQLWDADKMQLGLQILILRDNGYACDEGVIYYKGTRQRVPLPMTPELETWIVRNIEQARHLAASNIRPPPLVDSPKCVRCSLAPVCLPDESAFLQRRLPATQEQSGISAKRFKAEVFKPSSESSAPALRRLIAARDDERALYLNTQGARVTLRGEVLVVKEDKTVMGEFRLKDLSHLALFGNIQVTTQAIQTLCEEEIPIAYFSQGGWFYGLTRGHGLKNVHTRIKQFDTADDPRRCLALAQRFVHGKIRNHRTQLLRNHINLPDGVALKLKRAANDALAARSLPELLGIEGAAASMYFQNFAGMIKVNPDDDELPGLEGTPTTNDQPQFVFDFTKRGRRPPPDPVNAMLSLAYSILSKDCTLASLAVGFDPYVGYYHQLRHGRPALALDLMEEFRPLIAESTVLTALNNRMITPAHFVKAGDAVNLTSHGRKVFFQVYEQRINSLITHPIFDYKVSYRRIIELQARMLAKYLSGEIPEYLPMMTR